METFNLGDGLGRGGPRHLAGGDVRSLASLRRTLQADMTVSGRLFSKTTFDDIIVRRPICL
jgi:hypothetical protein